MDENVFRWIVTLLLTGISVIAGVSLWKQMKYTKCMDTVCAIAKRMYTVHQQQQKNQQGLG